LIDWSFSRIGHPFFILGHSLFSTYDRRHRMFNQRVDNPEQIGSLIDDAFSVLKKITTKAEVLRIFPLRCFSEQITNGCKIAARSQFLFERAGGWVFYQYAVKVTNLTEDKHLLLVTEDLEAIDENIQRKRVKYALGTFIKTKIPVLKPGESFEFSKRYPMQTRMGSISGTYLLLDTVTGQILEAQMAPFLLSDDNLGREPESGARHRRQLRNGIERLSLKEQENSEIPFEETTKPEVGSELNPAPSEKEWTDSQRIAISPKVDDSFSSEPDVTGTTTSPAGTKRTKSKQGGKGTKTQSQSSRSSFDVVANTATTPSPGAPPREKALP